MCPRNAPTHTLADIWCERYLTQHGIDFKHSLHVSDGSSYTAFLSPFLLFSPCFKHSSPTFCRFIQCCRYVYHFPVTLILWVPIIISGQYNPINPLDIPVCRLFALLTPYCPTAASVYTHPCTRCVLRHVCCGEGGPSNG